MDNAFEWYESNAADYEKDYKYKARNGRCDKSVTPSACKTTGYSDVTENSVN
jgi:hypothetical protein